MWYVYATEYYLSIKKNAIPLFPEKGIELKIIMLRKISQTEKGKYHMLSFIVEPRH
jgi:hypothetical protein